MRISVAKAALAYDSALYRSRPDDRPHTEGYRFLDSLAREYDADAFERLLWEQAFKRSFSCRPADSLLYPPDERAQERVDLQGD